ncbi:MAG: hypothetical protein ACREUG_09700, partial [Steroidobacteraceae bacterium]
LHEHPVNRRRARGGLPALSTLWLWGGGPRLAADAGSGGAAPIGSPASRSIAARSRSAALFSDDAYMAGLAHLVGTRIARGPRVAEGARALERAVSDDAPCRIVTLEPCGDPAQAVEILDSEWVAPALGLLARRALGRLTLILNDRALTMAAADRFRIWRRRRAALEALQ